MSETDSCAPRRGSDGKVYNTANIGRNAPPIEPDVAEEDAGEPEELTSFDDDAPAPMQAAPDGPPWQEFADDIASINAALRSTAATLRDVLQVQKKRVMAQLDQNRPRLPRRRTQSSLRGWGRGSGRRKTKRAEAAS